ncbi:MAG TPA: TerC family protein [Chitinophagaceae bacterium]|nr:TerC family protein [Chitinophagaceae bacterium]
MNHLFTVDSLVSFIILVILEIVLGIDNVIFVSIIINRLHKKEHTKARLFWVLQGMIIRSAMLLGLGWLLSQKGKTIITVLGKSFDIAGMVMLAGGIFLIYKSVKEIHGKLEGGDIPEKNENRKYLRFSSAAIQIVLVDMVFSFDSIITAGGTAQYVEIMIAAVVIALITMFLFSPKIAAFIHEHPTFKMLALSFLVMIGLSLVIEGWDAEKAEDLHLKNYIYFGMAFSFLVELLNMRVRKKTSGKLPVPDKTDKQ